jgi:hypothetical protein
MTSPIAGDFFFTPSADPDCVLPCWQGLRVGESGRDDVRRVFDEVFGFNGMLDFFSEDYLRYVEKSDDAAWSTQNLPDLYPTGYRWIFPRSDFVMTFWLDQNTDLLEGMSFYWQLPGDFAVASAQDVIRQLGTPDNLLASEPSPYGVELLFIYKEGLVFYFAGMKLSNTEWVQNKLTGTLCLNSEQGGAGRSFITKPLNPALNELSPLQARFTTHWLEIGNQMRPISYYYDITFEDLARRSTQEADVCIHTR